VIRGWVVTRLRGSALRSSTNRPRSRLGSWVPLPASLLPREIAVDHPPFVISLAPSPSTAKATTKSAPLLEAHLGAVVGAVAGVIGEGIEECRDGGLTPKTKSESAEFLCELVRLREFMISDFPDFDSLARRRGVEVLCACETPPATAEFLVDETMKLLEKLVRQQVN